MGIGGFSLNYPYFEKPPIPVRPLLPPRPRSSAALRIATVGLSTAMRTVLGTVRSSPAVIERCLIAWTTVVGWIIAWVIEGVDYVFDWILIGRE